MTTTVLDEIERALRDALAHNEDAEVAPVVLLWPDRDGQFAEAARRLRARMPLMTLGELDEAERRGPSYWLRCAATGTLQLERGDGTPVLYLPGAAREDLRAIEDCPRELAPIAELQYRGQWFSHPNGKDWTVRGFLANRERGLGLSVAEDARTAEALMGAFGRMLDLPLRRLATQHIDAGFLHHLLNPDPAARLLEWLDGPTGFRSRLDDAEWKAFVALCRKDYDFDPATQGEVTGGRLLGMRQGAWAEVWGRFEQDPERYPGIEERLRKGRPQELLPEPVGSWPQDNEDAESNLRAALKALAGATAGQARKAVEQLWNEHADRRLRVWARLERAPLAFALEQLQRLAELTVSGPAATVEKLTSTYANGGWQADDAFVAALRAAPEPPDREAVVGAAVALYRPWLEAHARALQDAIGPQANAGTYAPGEAASTKKGTVTVFVDGLRLDVAHRLSERLGGLDVTVDCALAALPTVTATTKPVLTPVPNGALSAGQDLGPARATSGARVNITVLRGLMAEQGVQVLQGADCGDPSGTAWTEAADIDKRGHEFGVALVDELDRELDAVARRVRLLLEAGWKQVDVVTDHGWILLPGGLEKIDLPAATVDVKKGRCARLKEGASVSVPTVPWHWDPNVRIALAPGIACFEANQVYEHGGVSLQECVVPRIRIRAAATEVATSGATITRVKWLGLMCRVEFENVPSGAAVDLRALPADPKTSVAQTVKETTSAGKQSLHVPDDTLEGEKAFVVIVASDGSILAQRDVTIGVNR